MYLVIGPGGLGFFAFLGALSAIGLENVDEVSGSSAGALLGLFICCGKTIEEIVAFCFSVDIKELSKISVMSLISRFGLIPHAPIKKILKEFCGDVKFRDLPKKLHVTSFCVNKCETEYFSVDNVPDMSVIDAVCMSISVPFLFEAIKYNGFTYIDGGTRECNPDLAFINKNPSDVLILTRENHRKHCEIHNFKDFIMALVGVAVESGVKGMTNVKTITIDFNAFDFNMFDFSIGTEEKMKFFTAGYNAVFLCV